MIKMRIARRLVAASIGLPGDSCLIEINFDGMRIFCTYAKIARLKFKELSLQIFNRSLRVQKSYPWAHYFIIFGFVLLLMGLGQFGNGQIVWASGTNYQRGTVPTKTPTPDPSAGSGKSESQNTSHILGKVTDLSTGQPGRDVTVQLNDVTVKTDSFGNYSLSGLSAGQFTVVLLLEGDATPAQELITVAVDGTTDVRVDLAYYSIPPQAEPLTAPITNSVTVAITDTTLANDETGSANIAQSSEMTDQSEPESPQILPTAGTVKSSARIWILLAAGLVFVLAGVILDIKQR